MLDFRIDTFITVCKHMNFTRAAEELHITQPAVSQHIRFLEEAYGTRLFTYQGKKMSLTPGGALLLGAVTTMKHDTIYLKDKLLELQKNQKTLRFGATLTIGGFAMPGSIAAYLRGHPETLLRMTVSNTADLLRKLDRGEIDFALVEGFFTKSDYDSLTYSSEPYIAVCGPDRSFSQTPQPLEALFSQRLILREPGSGTREVLEKYLSMRSLSIQDFPCRMEISDINAIKTLVRMSCGITFLYEVSVKEELEAGLLKKIPLENFQVAHDFTYIWRRNSIFSEAYHDLFLALKTGQGENESTPLPG